MSDRLFYEIYYFNFLHIHMYNDIEKLINLIRRNDIKIY